MKKIMEQFLTVVSLIIVVGLGTGYNSMVKDSGPVKSQYNPNIVAISYDLRYLVNDYINTLESNGIKLPYGRDLVLIDFSMSLPDNVLGMALGMNVDNVTVVLINGNKWFELSDNQKKLLVFHELSHDIFNLYHFSTPVMDTPMPLFVSDQHLDLSIQSLINHLKFR